jgi:hypothetical protein
MATVTRPVYDAPCGNMLDRYGTAQRFGPYGPCVLPLGHPGLHAVESGEQWGRADRSTWEHEPHVPDDWDDDDDDSLDFDIATVSDHVRIIPISTRALEWFWGRSQPKQWPYFHFQQYGDERAIGRYWRDWDDEFNALLAQLERAGFRVAAEAE